MLLQPSLPINQILEVIDFLIVIFHLRPQCGVLLQVYIEHVCFNVLNMLLYQDIPRIKFPYLETPAIF